MLLHGRYCCRSYLQSKQALSSRPPISQVGRSLKDTRYESTRVAPVGRCPILQPYAISAFVTLHEKGLAFEAVALDLDTAQNQTADFAQRSVNQRVPTPVQVFPIRHALS
ncbi:hypothetical protein ACMSI6_20465 [Pseudomonas antarctica]|uniref:hypothetical protein n=1 Tax=Pseudomonas antarctica TaxID=219572 RepID=UPI0039C26593